MRQNEIVRIAETMWKVGAFREAWGTLDAVAAGGRAEAEVADLRCRICIALGSWEKGGELAEVLAVSPDESNRITAAEFYSAYARELAESGDAEAARPMVERAVRCWPAISEEIMADSLLARMR
ncbi:hypothetical protein BH23VER1_BH23VER1_35150 [soil metagenome]